MNRRRKLTTSSEEQLADLAPTFGHEEGPESSPTETSDEGSGDFQATEETWEEEHSRAPQFDWVIQAIGTLALLTWTGFFGWTHYQEIQAGASLQQWTQWISVWAMPSAFIVGVLILLQRNSRREANRFAETARLLSTESVSLETRLKVVNRELSLARDFIASQSRDLESLGRIAAEKLNGSADQLQSLIKENSEQVETIGVVSENAVTNLEHLRDNLPVLTNAARDLSSQIGNAGNVAHAQIEGLVSGFDRLNQFGEAGDRHVSNIAEKVTATLAAFDAQVAQLGETTQARFGKLREVSESFRTDMVETEDAALQSIRIRADELQATLIARHSEMREAEDAALANLQARLEDVSGTGEELVKSLAEGREAAAEEWRTTINDCEIRLTEVIDRISQVDQSAMENARRRLSAITDEAALADAKISESLSAFDAELQRRRDESSAQQVTQLAELEDRMSVFDAAIASKRQGFEALANDLTAKSEALFARLSEVEGNIEALRRTGDDTHALLGGAADDFADRLSKSREALEENNQQIAQLTDDSVRLLEIIRSGAEHSQGTLTEAISDAETRLTNFVEEAQRLSALIMEAEEGGARLESHVSRVNTAGAESFDQLTNLETKVSSITEKSEALAAQTRTELEESISSLTNSAEDALARLHATQSEVVQEIASSIAAESRERIAEAIRNNASEVLAELDEAVSTSSTKGQQTTKMLRDQLALLNELAGNLEQRIAYARARAEEKIDTDFSRRMALITESLNSSAIDIAKAFENEVSDTQWANYLKGDRGIFTRRAVKLLDKGESRAVAEVYEEDAEFRETVNRFIHDFEAMLREVLATRDGNALAVTLLSSDTGKLYVALAQAIERLRN